MFGPLYFWQLILTSSGFDLSEEKAPKTTRVLLLLGGYLLPSLN